MANLLQNVQVAGGFIGDAINVTSGIASFRASQEQGDHIAISAVKSAGNFAIGEIFYGAMQNQFGVVGSTGALIGYQIASTAAQTWLMKKQSDAKALSAGTESVKRLGSGHFDMTQAGYTMRQRSLNAIRSNGANLNSAFGNEARNYWLGL